MDANAIANAVMELLAKKFDALTNKDFVNLKEVEEALKQIAAKDPTITVNVDLTQVTELLTALLAKEDSETTVIVEIV